MFSDNHSSYLIRQLSQNNVVLFLGSGFSFDAKNKAGTNFPVGNQLAELIWNFLDLSGSYDGTSLKDMFEILLNSSKKNEEINNFLEENLLASEVPEFYDNITIPYWRRIYTTNIDNVLNLIYNRNIGTKLDILKYPFDEPKERDQFLSRIQCIYLNGLLPSDPKDLIFSKRQYAETSLIHQPFYELFAREYATHCTIFLGTSFEEDLIWQYIVARETRPSGVNEKRLKSYLISKHIPTPKKMLLHNYNLIPIEAGTKDFLEYIESIAHKLPSKNDLLKKLYPNLIDFGNNIREKKYVDAIHDFSFSFEKVPADFKSSENKSFYLLGASPSWNDIFGNLDARRSITFDILETVTNSLEDNSNFEILALLGHAGAGKSTILKRVGVELSQDGWNTFYTSSEQIPRFDNISKALETFDNKSVLLFDNAEIILRRLSGLIKELNDLPKPPIIILSARINDYDRNISKYDNSIKINEFIIPDLNRKEIEDIINILDDNNLLGKLNGLNDWQRIKEFEVRAQKQILVAMREATSGKGFDEIIKDEFIKIEPNEAKLLCLCASLATDAGFRISIDEFVGCSKETPAEALHYLNRNLKGIAILSGVNKDLVGIRHRAIANHYISCCDDVNMIKDAYVRILGVLSNEIKSSHWSTRVFSLYRDLINHNSVYKRFHSNINEARNIYESIINKFNDDFHFWLQYGSLELEGGDLQLAENYLNQAKSLEPHDNYVINSIGHLEMRKAIEATSLSESIKFLEKGERILKEQILKTGSNDPYCYHIYCLQKYTWIRLKVKDEEQKKKQLRDLLDTIETAVEEHPLSKRLEKLKEIIMKAYLNMSIRIEDRPDDPIYTYGWD